MVRPKAVTATADDTRRWSQASAPLGLTIACLNFTSRSLVSPRLIQSPKSRDDCGRTVRDRAGLGVSDRLYHQRL
jgi:hypothetical protein